MVRLKQTIPLQIFERLSPTNFTWSILEYFFAHFIANDLPKHNISTGAISLCLMNPGIYTILCFPLKYFWISSISLTLMVSYLTEKSYTYSLSPTFFVLSTVKPFILLNGVLIPNGSTIQMLLSL